MIWAYLLPFLSLVLPVVAVAALALHLVRAVRRRRLLSPRPRRRWAELAVLAGAIGGVVYGLGNWQGHVIDLRPADEICGGEIARALTQSPLPLRNVCHFVDGSSVDLVPGWVNPVVMLALGAVVFCTILALRTPAAEARTPSLTPGRSA